MIRRTSTLVAAAALLTTLLAGCGDGSSNSSTTTVPTIITPTTTAPPVSSNGTGNTDEKKTPDANPTALLTAVRAAHQGTGDRVTFEFEGNTVPGYTIGYTTEPQVGTDGKTVAVSGDFVLRARFAMASGVDLSSPSGFRQTYNGPTRFTPTGTNTVTEVVRVDDFEAIMVWAMGTHTKAPFTVSTLSDPARIVVDFEA